MMEHVKSSALTDKQVEVVKATILRFRLLGDHFKMSDEGWINYWKPWITELRRVGIDDWMAYDDHVNPTRFEVKLTGAKQSIKVNFEPE